MTAVPQNHASGAALPPGANLGRFEILAKLAAGGMAVVYAARSQGVAGFQRLVALKVLHANLAHEEEFISMFLDEARLAARIRHPNVASTIDISDSPEVGYFLVMDYIEGDHLGRLLAAAHKRGERLPVPVVMRIVADALAGLGAAHELTDDSGRRVNLVHRDVSPHNLMVGTDGVARLTDFGVAKAEDRITHTRDGQVKGKLAYMAPEQASTGVADQRSDLFAMGVILWECLTGRRLFRANNAAATLNKLINGSIPPPSSVDSGLEPIDLVLRRALNREPGERFQDAEAFISAIEQAARDLGGMASHREVGRLVRRLAEEKLERDRRMIRTAERMVDRGEHDEHLSEPSLPSRSAQSSLSFTQSASRSTHTSLPSLESVSVLPPAASALSIPPPQPIGKDQAGPTEGDGAGGRRLGMAMRWSVLLSGVVACAVVAWISTSNEQTVTVTPIEVEAPSSKGAAPVQSGEPPSASMAVTERVPVSEPSEAPSRPASRPATTSIRGQRAAADVPADARADVPAEAADATDAAGSAGAPEETAGEASAGAQSGDQTHAASGQQRPSESSGQQPVGDVEAGSQPNTERARVRPRRPAAAATPAARKRRTGGAAQRRKRVAPAPRKLRDVLANPYEQ